MGCVCSKGSSANEYIENNGRDKELSKKSSKRHTSSSRRDGAVLEGYGGINDATARLIPTQSAEENAASSPVSWDKGQKKSMPVDRPAIRKSPETEGGMNAGQPQMNGIVRIGNGVEAAQAAAGWPSWLTAVAAEAINGWVPRKADSFERLDKVSLVAFWLFVSQDSDSFSTVT